MHRRPQVVRLSFAALVAIGALALPMPAGATRDWRIQLVRQDPVAVISASNVAPVHVAVAIGGSNGDERTLQVDLFARVTTRSGLTGVMDQSGLNEAPLASTGSFAANCRTNGVASFTVEVGGASTNATTCGGASAFLHLGCAPSSCAGVYPIEITATNGANVSSLWSLLTITDPNPRYVQTAWVLTSTPLNNSVAEHEATALRALTTFSQSPVAVAPSYVGLTHVLYDRSGGYHDLFHSFVQVFNAKSHLIVGQPVASVDLATPATHGLLSNVADQVRFAPSVISATLPRPASNVVVLSGTVTPGDISALSAVGVRRVVIDDEALKYPPSNTLNWGTPFRVDTAPSNVIAAATDSPLRELAIGPNRTGVLRATLALGTLALLHFEAPYATPARTVVVDVSLSTTSYRFLSTLFQGLTHNQVVHLVGVPAAVSQRNVGAGGFPSVRSLATGDPATWNAANVTTAKVITGRINSFSHSVPTPRPTMAATSTLLASERRISPAERQRELSISSTSLAGEFAKFDIDATTITLTGTAPLPITVTSSAKYAYFGWIRLSAPGVSFPNGATVPVNVNGVAQSVRVPVSITGSGNFTLTAQLLSFDQRTVVASSAIQVRSATNSIVGYVLSIGSLFVIALWWWRTSRKKDVKKEPST